MTYNSNISFISYVNNFLCPFTQKRCNLFHLHSFSGLNLSYVIRENRAFGKFLLHTKEDMSHSVKKISQGMYA
jgi:hypothetical protein